MEFFQLGVIFFEETCFSSTASYNIFSFQVCGRCFVILKAELPSCVLSKLHLLDGHVLLLLGDLAITTWSTGETASKSPNFQELPPRWLWRLCGVLDKKTIRG